MLSGDDEINQLKDLYRIKVINFKIFIKSKLKKIFVRISISISIRISSSIIISILYFVFVFCKDDMS